MKKLQAILFVVNGKEHKVPYTDVDKFIKQIAKTKVDSISIQEPTLENIFLDLYKEEDKK
jgi:hypothetical protein